MRNIKVRVWCVKAKCWYDGPVEFHVKDPINKFDGDSYITMEYTGLNDKNEREIYEGDIIKTVTPIYKNEMTDIVIFEQGAFCLQEIRCYIGNINDLCRVIGNIYENPELLKDHESV